MEIEKYQEYLEKHYQLRKEMLGEHLSWEIFTTAQMSLEAFFRRDFSTKEKADKRVKYLLDFQFNVDVNSPSSQNHLKKTYNLILVNTKTVRLK